ncbi:unnamed protein product [Boreogadus saida]
MPGGNKGALNKPSNGLRWAVVHSVQREGLWLNALRSPVAQREEPASGSTLCVLQWLSERSLPLAQRSAFSSGSARGACLWLNALRSPVAQREEPASGSTLCVLQWPSERSLPLAQRSAFIASSERTSGSTLCVLQWLSERSLPLAQRSAFIASSERTSGSTLCVLQWLSGGAYGPDCSSSSAASCFDVFVCVWSIKKEKNESYKSLMNVADNIQTVDDCTWYKFSLDTRYVLHKLLKACYEECVICNSFNLNLCDDQLA